MRFRSFIASVVLLVLATSTVGCAVVCDQYVADSSEVTPPTRDVVVAADFIPAGETIQTNMLVGRQVFVDDWHESAISDPDEVAGSVAVISIIATQPITPYMLEPLAE